MLRSAKTLHGIISEQIDKGIPSERIVVGGFSQGGAIAILVFHPSMAPVGTIVSSLIRV